MERLDTIASLKYFAPEIVLVFTLMAVLLFDLIAMKRSPAERRLVIVLPTLIGLSTALVFALQLFDAPTAGLFSNMVALDGFGALLRILFILTALFVLLFTIPSRELSGVHQGELLVLLVTVTVALIWMANSINLVMIYLTLETVSIASYVMVGYLKTDRLSNEASLKYILFGAVSTGTMLYGLSLLYGLTGTLDVYGIRSALQTQGALVEIGPALMISVLMVLAGIGFKMATVPFHFWCPDVYTGAPTPVTAFLSVGPKVAGFAVLVRLFYGGLAAPEGDASWAMVGSVDWQSILIGISVVTMTLGNVAALLQTNLKRLLAYSSVAHAGYIMMGAVVLSEEGIQAMLAYIVIYLFMNLGAFLVVIIIHNGVGSFEISDYAGIWRRSPTLTIVMGIFLFSLMGIPPFAGFLAKWYVFAAVIDAQLGWLAVIGVLNSAVGAFYYLKILKTMFIDGEETPAAPSSLPLHPIYAGLLFVLAVPNIIGLVLWGYLDRITEYSQKLLEIL
ncbi:MAG TPA: NADH-quinone oxidoreductase subunit N [Vicinamibacteria bacterium]|nr:NADH-quinone oxidoreductase subunit N [Vicinamibacteria bacterium]